VHPFRLSEADKRDLARVLELDQLPLQVSEAVATVTAIYRAEAAGSTDTTIGNTLAELAELGKKGRAYKRSAARLADDRSGVDYVTHATLQPLARAVLANEPGAQQMLARAAQARTDQLHAHKRVDPKTEALRQFCGWLRLIFNGATDHLKGHVTTEDAWHKCRQFALAVFTVAGIDHADFVVHPNRLTEYLGTDVSPV